MRNIILITLIGLIGCNIQSNTKTKTSDTIRVDSKQNRKESEILTIKNKCAIIYSPDSIKINDYLKSDSIGFYTSSNDAMFYISQTREFLENNNIKIIETDARYIDFYKDNSLLDQFDLSGKNKSWGLIFYNGIDKPEESDLTYNEEDFNRIMKK